jgi:glycosyltransferase involved in cell wall biosynthesis
MEKTRLLRITTVPLSLHVLLRGQFRYMLAQGFEVHTMSAPGKETDDVLLEGAPHHVVPMTRKITPWQDLVCLWKIIRIMRQVRPHIVHTHTPKAGLLGMLAAWYCRVPVRMHTVAGLPLMETRGLTRRLLEVVEKITYWCAHRVYPNAEGLKEFIVQRLHVSPRKLTVIGRGSTNGIDTTLFKRTPALEEEAAAIRQRHGIRPGDVVFSFVGRIVKDKGIGELIQAFRRLSEASSERLFLLLIGAFEQDLDPLTPEDYAFLQQDPRVILAGFQRDVKPWIMASDVFVFPSYREGFPNVVMQACCLEMPCVVSDINGCNEIIRRGETGLIVKPKDAGALFTAMNTLMHDAALRQSFSTAARSYVVANFDQQYVWTSLREEYYRQVADRKVPRLHASA